MKKLIIICLAFLILAFGCVQEQAVKGQDQAVSGNELAGKNAVGFTSVEVTDFKLMTDGSLYLSLKNSFGEPIKIQKIKASWEQKSEEKTASIDVGLGTNASSDELNPVNFSSKTGAGNQFRVHLEIEYADESRGFAYTETGYVYGSVE